MVYDNNTFCQATQMNTNESRTFLCNLSQLLVRVSEAVNAASYNENQTYPEAA